MNYDLKVYDNANLVGELKVFDYRFFNFTYDISWLKNNESYEIDPAYHYKKIVFLAMHCGEHSKILAQIDGGEFYKIATISTA